MNWLQICLILAAQFTDDFMDLNKFKVSIPHEKTNEENLIFVVCYAD